VVLDHELPNSIELHAVATGLEGVDASDAKLAACVEAAAGLTRTEAENAFALSQVRNHGFDPKTIWELKAQTLAKGGLVRLHQSTESFAGLGGLDGLKQFCIGVLALRDGAKEKPKGVLLLGVPGTGKSAFSKALGNEVGRPTLTLDLGALMGSLVGQTEANVRRALATVDAMSPCVLFIDEIEKGLAGSTAGAGDSGVAARLFGTLLTWLNDRTSDVFVVATSNDVSALPPEFARAERFDAIFYLDLPTRPQKDAVWRMYGTAFGVSVDRPPADEQWTPAEVKACCRLAALLGLTVRDAAKHIVPVAATGAEAIGKLRRWADRRCLDAETGAVFNAEIALPTRRTVRREPSAN
jgi:hypothetical protein